MTGHRLEAEETVRGDRKVIRYRCPVRGCKTRGTISTVPQAAADRIFAVVREGHAGYPGDQS